MEGIQIPNLSLPGRGGKGNRLEDSLVADLFARLSTAPVGTLVLSGLASDTKGKAGSDGYAYRNALRDRGVPVKSRTITVEDLRAAIIATAEAATPPVPPLEVPADADAATAKKLRDAHKQALKDRADAIADAVPEAYRTAPGKSWTWALQRAAEVQPDGDA